MHSRLSKLFICAALVLASIGLTARAQETPCAFEDAALSYKGTPQEQARCLLRPVLIGGQLGAQLKRLPAPLDKLIGKHLKVNRVQLQLFLEQQGIKPLAGELSRSLGGPPPVITGRYRLGDVRHITADCTAAEQILSWRAHIELDCGLAQLDLTA